MNESTSRLAIPEDFAKPSGAYRMQAWLAMLGLLAFIVLYVGLASYFSYTAYRMLAGVVAGGDGAVGGFFLSLPAMFLAVFMWKALFFVRAGSTDPGIEITEAEEPGLFKFLYEIADEIGAPRPHRVFLSPDVNASVFYDLSILNFVLPSKKNLCIGLGLVNSLGRSEMKAVLAHEFGHFAQRTMAVGSWVYIGEQIAGHIIAKRDFLDSILDFISAIDIRVAWIGWIMRLVVWSIRSLMESVFRLVVLAQRALSREMEFQADKVAVSLTGSDALVNGLYRLQPADEDWQDTLNFANAQLSEGRRISNFYVVQERIGVNLRRILNEPTRGLAPPVPVSGAATHRVFTKQLAAPPRMWATHPPNTEREENAKEIYIPAKLDNESAWALFRDAAGWRTKMSDFLFQDVKLEKPPEKLTDQQTVAELDKEYADTTFDPRYQGAYLGRMVTLCSAEAVDLMSVEVPRDQITDELLALYPEGLHDRLTEWRNFNEEIGMLEAIEAGVFGGGGGVVHHRGNPIRRSQLPSVIESVKAERDAVLSQIEQHDRRCRAVHNTAARYVAYGWQDYLNNMTELLHYAEHSGANLADAHGHLAVTTNVAIASGRVSGAKLKRVMDSANDLHSVMARLDQQASSLKLPPNVASKFGDKSWRDVLPKHELPGPTNENIGEWLGVIDGWVQPVKERLATLRKAALGELLRAEDVVALMHSGEVERTNAPASGATPPTYRTLRRGTERKRQTKLDWWTKFTIADGVFPSLMRFGVAGSIVAGVVAASTFVGNAKVVIYNGLSIPVTVQLDEQEMIVRGSAYRKMNVGAKRSGLVKAYTQDGAMIESFDASMDKGFATYVYNIAGAAPMVESTAVYGNAAERPPKIYGARRWGTTGADSVFTAAPASVSVERGSGATRLVLNNPKGFSVGESIALMQSDAEREAFIRTHLQWDDANSANMEQYLELAMEWPDFWEITDQRLSRDPKDIVTMRVQQEAAKGEAKERLEKAHRELGRIHADDADYQYIAIRALPDGDEQDQAFLAGHNRWPQNVWFAYAAGFVLAGRGEWQKASDAFDIVTIREGPVFDNAVVTAARVKRMIAGDREVAYTHRHRCRSLKYLLAYESGEGLKRNSPEFAYSWLQKGGLDDAYRLSGRENASDALKILLGASKGAKPEWQEAVFKTASDKIDDPALLFYKAALASQLGKANADEFRRLNELYEGRPSVIPLVQRLLAAGGNIDESDLETELAGVYPREQGIVNAVLTMLRGDETLPRVRRAATTLLFGTERPYL